MKKDILNKYWLTIEPYVYIGLTNTNVLLYNTLDGETIRSENINIIKLLQEILKEDNGGIVLLSHEELNNDNIKYFIEQLREKFMGDIIPVSLSKNKPVQIYPLFNSSNIIVRQNIYKKQNFTSEKSSLNYLTEIYLVVDSTTDINHLIPLLDSFPRKLIIHIIGNPINVNDYNKLLEYLQFNPFAMNIIHCQGGDIIKALNFDNTCFKYKIEVRFPINECDRRLFSSLGSAAYEFLFFITSEQEYQESLEIINTYDIDNYNISPVYTGKNLGFFEKNVFLDEEDILSNKITIKDIFTRQILNINDFGKLTIFPNGDVYANPINPRIGNIYSQEIKELIDKELESGASWLRIRNSPPCCNCVYQWLCPSPSNYELEIGRANLCNLCKNK